MADQLADSRYFPVGYQGIESQMDRHAANMAVFDGFGQGLGCEIFRALAGVEGAAAQIDRVGTVLHRRAQGLHRPGRSQQFQHNIFSPSPGSKCLPAVVIVLLYGILTRIITQKNEDFYPKPVSS